VIGAFGLVRHEAVALARFFLERRAPLGDYLKLLVCGSAPVTAHFISEYAHSRAAAM
jgi:hypothetical protein